MKNSSCDICGNVANKSYLSVSVPLRINPDPFVQDKLKEMETEIVVTATFSLSNFPEKLNYIPDLCEDCMQILIGCFLASTVKSLPENRGSV